MTKISTAAVPKKSAFVSAFTPGNTHAANGANASNV
jgi:hypothetical protein